MISIETQARALKIFFCLIDFEKSVEILRQILSKQDDFEPYTIFRRLDKESKSYIDELDIKNFLK